MAKLAMTLKIRVAIMMFFLAELQTRGGVYWYKRLWSTRSCAIEGTVVRMLEVSGDDVHSPLQARMEL